MQDDFKKYLNQIGKLITSLFALILALSGILVMMIVKPGLFDQKTEIEEVAIKVVNDTTIENGIHVSTGLLEAEGLMEVVNNCTNCHSAKLVTQNRMNAERWKTTIDWMQETQNLWDLGKNEDIIINYLVTNYPPEPKGRRAGLSDIEWYDLKE